MLSFDFIKSKHIRLLFFKKLMTFTARSGLPLKCSTFHDATENAFAIALASLIQVGDEWFLTGTLPIRKAYPRWMPDAGCWILDPGCLIHKSD